MLAVMTVLLLIYTSNHFVRILADIDSGSLQFNVIALMLSLKTVSALAILLPLALFLSVLVAFGRLYKDSEAVAMEACAVSPRVSLHAVMGFAVLIAVLVAVLSLYIAPWAEERAYQIQDQQSASSELVGLVSGRFIEPSGSNGVIYAEQISADHKSMHTIFIQGDLPGEQLRQLVLAAKSGQQQHDPRSGDNFLVLENGFRYEGTPGERDYRIIEYQRHAVRISEPPVSRSYRKHRARTSLSLMSMEQRSDLAELQWRLSMPISALLLALLAVPLSRTPPRQGKYSRLFIAVLVYVVYSNLLGVAQTWVEQGTLPGIVGLWWVHIALAVLIWWLLARQYGHSWLLRALHLTRPA
jgi:lipopolysaccharide export system permease protein